MQRNSTWFIGITSIAASVLIGVAALWWYFNPDSGKSYIEIDRFTVGEEEILLYADYGWESAALGFIQTEETGDDRFSPFYFSLYRGLPPVRLQVFRSNSNDAFWVYAIWNQNSLPEVLAYHQLNSETYLCSFGSKKSIDTPVPAQMSGGRPNYPALDRASSTLILEASYPSEQKAPEESVY